MDLLPLVLLHHTVHEVEEFQPPPAFVMPARDFPRANVERREQRERQRSDQARVGDKGEAR